MTGERTGFIVVQVWATIAYTDKDGQPQQIAKQAPSECKHKLSDAEKQKRKVSHAQRIIRQTIAELKRGGAMDCKGAVNTRILARVGHTDDQGKRRDIVRVAASRTDARDKIKEILRDLETRNGKTINAARMTFADIKHLETHYLTEAEYIDGRKVSGVRSLVPAQAAVNALKQYFGKRRLQVSPMAIFAATTRPASKSRRVTENSGLLRRSTENFRNSVAC
jgi:hypothetical protein